MQNGCSIKKGGIHMNKKIYLKNPRRLISGIIGMIALTILLMLMLQETAFGKSIPKYATVVVTKGDTLWTIANDYYENERDIRNKIEEIKEINNMKTSSIKTGQELRLRIQ
jgi:LysM repeat protein